MSLNVINLYYTFELDLSLLSTIIFIGKIYNFYLENNFINKLRK